MSLIDRQVDVILRLDYGDFHETIFPSFLRVFSLREEDVYILFQI